MSYAVVWTTCADCGSETRARGPYATHEAAQDAADKWNDDRGDGAPICVHFKVVILEQP